MTASFLRLANLLQKCDSTMSDFMKIFAFFKFYNFIWYTEVQKAGVFWVILMPTTLWQKCKKICFSEV